MIYTDFVLDNGQFIRVECPSKYETEFWDSVHDAMKLGDSWSPDRFSGCSAELLGMRMNRINFARVVGTL
jgi:hypothetical protein